MSSHSIALRSSTDMVESVGDSKRTSSRLECLKYGGGLSKFQFPAQMKSMFWLDKPLQKKGYQVLHENPHIYLVHDFITDSEIDHIDNIVTQHSETFLGKRARSYTESNDGEKLISR